MWQDCKPHAFNACFDDSRVKCWRWLIYMSKQKKWPIKFSFFYNTLWITRDYYLLREWIDMGHEICGHMHEHMCPCATEKVVAWGPDGPSEWAPYTDQNLADDLTMCAKLLRKLYNEPDRELIIAWPHGAFPLIDENVPCGKPDGQDCGAPNPHDGKPRELAIKARANNYIAARSTMMKNYNTWPNPAILPPTPGGTWKQPLWPYNIDPKWGWPYPIEIDPPSVANPDELCKGYESQMNKALSLPNGVLIFAGHTFAPTDADGNDVPCGVESAGQMKNGPYNGSWCKDPDNCNDTFVCPKDIRDITKSCWTNAEGTPLPLYDANGRLSDPVFPPNKNLGMIPPENPECNQCCDACWDPVPGSCLIKLFDEVTANADIYWFATFTEIVQYTYNRQNSKLYPIDKNNFILECGKMYNCPITLSFGTDDFSATVDGKSVKTFMDPISNKYYIKFIPKSGNKHNIHLQ